MKVELDWKELIFYPLWGVGIPLCFIFVFEPLEKKVSLWLFDSPFLSFVSSVVIWFGGFFLCVWAIMRLYKKINPREWDEL